MRVRSSSALVKRLFMAALVIAISQLEGRPHAQPAGSPNILFIILDDVGKDQLASFNPAAGTAALTPNLNAIAAEGGEVHQLLHDAGVLAQPGRLLYGALPAPHRRRRGHSRSGSAGVTATDDE